MDAFGSLFSVPFQLTTLEAVRHINRVMKDDGVVIFNLGGAIKGDIAKFLQAELNTYSQVFPKVFLFKINVDYTDEQLQNLIIVACKEKNAAIAASDDAEISNMLKHLYVEDIKSDIEVFTDDLAPVEHYNSFAHRFYRSAK